MEEPMVQPLQLTFGERFSILKERVLHGRASNEPGEFLEEFEKLLRLRSQLRNVEKGVKKWLASSKSLSTSAMYLAQAVDTDQETFRQLSGDMVTELQDKSTLKAIAKKLSMLDDLVNDRKALVNLRHLKNRWARKAQAALDKELDDETKQRILARENKATGRYVEHYAQLLAAIKFVVGEAEEHGHCSLISPELSAFKLSQFQFFLNAQKIIQGSEKEDAQDLNDEWNKFTVQLSEQKERAKSEAGAALRLDRIPGLDEDEDDDEDDEEFGGDDDDDEDDNFGDSDDEDEEDDGEPDDDDFDPRDLQGGVARLDEPDEDLLATPEPSPQELGSGNPRKVSFVGEADA